MNPAPMHLKRRSLLLVRAPDGHIIALRRGYAISDEGYGVSVPGLPGCHSQGSTEVEAIENIKIVIVEYLDVLSEPAKGQNVREVDVRL